MTWKITPSLYSAWHFYAKPLFDRTDEQEQQARAEFIRALSKEQGEETDHIRRGVLFEQMIMQGVETGGVSLPDALDAKGKPLFNPEKHDRQCALHIAEMVRGGLFQVKDGKELPSGNYIYGVADCILLNGGGDFKYVSEYEMGKYQKSIQHLAYMYIWNLPQFYYFIADGSPIPFIEPYMWGEGSLALLDSRIAEMIHWINCDEELRNIFSQKWTYEKAKNEITFDV